MFAKNSSQRENCKQMLGGAADKEKARLRRASKLLIILFIVDYGLSTSRQHGALYYRSRL